MILLQIIAVLAIMYGVAAIILSFFDLRKYPLDRYGNKDKSVPPTGDGFKLKFKYPVLTAGIIVTFAISCIIKIGAQDAGVLVTQEGLIIMNFIPVGILLCHTTRFM